MTVEERIIAAAVILRDAIEDVDFARQAEAAARREVA